MRDRPMRAKLVPWLGLLLLPGMLLPQACLSFETAYNLRAVDNTILPGYQRLADETAALAKQTLVFCQQPSDPDLHRLQEQFHLSMDSWQFIQTVRLGPIEEKLRGYRLHFWPDKRQSVSRHLAKLLNKADPETLKSEAFAKGSVALQGFSALERLLFAADNQPGEFSSDGPKAHHCQVMVAITRNMTGIAREIAAEWQTMKPSHRDLIASAARGNQAYADSTEVSARLFNSLFTQIELMLDRKLRAPLGESQQRARGKRSESWRSGRSLRNMALNLQSVHQLTQTAFLSRLVDPPLKRRINELFQRSAQQISQIALPLAQAVTDPIQRERVVELTQTLTALKQALTEELAPALEIPIGFNSLDGD